MISELNGEWQQGVGNGFSQDPRPKLALELWIELSVFHLFRADPGIFNCLFLGHHLNVVVVERVQAPDDLGAVAVVGDGTSAGGLIDRDSGDTGSARKGILKDLGLFVCQLSDPDADADPVSCLCFDVVSHEQLLLRMASAALTMQIFARSAVYPHYSKNREL